MQETISLVIGYLILLIAIFITYKLLKKKRENEKTKKPKIEPSQSIQIKKYTCLDRHAVRSKGELIIDNYLYLLKIDHKYEKSIHVLGSKIKYDWYLPKYDVYIEYWGYGGKAYEKRKKEKLRLYKKAKLRLISIENYMFYDIYSEIDRLLKKFINVKNLRKLINLNQLDYNYGTQMVERY
ncbi:MAG: hypothetical protein KGD73_04910 [Candidatus Lokiarchaeota archaeon]|nr:hypothetical protein [Candidatus Lokiarchaeota archaeon]